MTSTKNFRDNIKSVVDFAHLADRMGVLFAPGDGELDEEEREVAFRSGGMDVLACVVYDYKSDLHFVLSLTTSGVKLTIAPAADPISWPLLYRGYKNIHDALDLYLQGQIKFGR